MPPQVAIIIVNWNGKADTLECLKSLQGDSYQNKRIIVVDNGSSDDSISAIRIANPEVTVLETGTNLGFTGGNNVGINHALRQKADYVYLLNNDTTVEPSALAALVEAAEAHPDFGLMTPVIHYYDKPEEAWFAGSQMDLSRGAVYHDNSHVPGRTEALRAIPWACGCAMLIRAEVLRQTGGFDDRYYLNWEDADLSLRIRSLGFTVGLVPKARIYHKVGRSFKRSGHGYYYFVRNNLLFVSLYAGKEARRASVYVIVDRLRESLRAIKQRQPLSRIALLLALRAIKDHLWHRYGSIAINS